MDKNEAQQLLLSEDYNDRLKAARFFANNPSAAGSFLMEALATERVTPVRRALTRVVNKIDPEPGEDDKDSDEYRQLMRDEALREATGIVLHELSPIIGMIILAAQTEIQSFEDSETSHELARLTSLLKAFETWNKAARSPNDEEFDLSELIKQVAKQESAKRSPVMVELVGATPFPVIGDGILIELALRNGLRNALEATETLPRHDAARKILITWDETPEIIWVAVLDRGSGLPLGVEAQQLGASTKQGHLGMGLAVARQAVRSLGGELFLQPRLEGGARYEFNWPKKRTP
jgi:signal transduction histidine kinase